MSRFIRLEDIDVVVWSPRAVLGATQGQINIDPTEIAYVLKPEAPKGKNWACDWPWPHPKHKTASNGEEVVCLGGNNPNGLTEDEQEMADKLCDAGMTEEQAEQWVRDIVIAAQKRG
jgi:hypothetical protein